MDNQEEALPEGAPTIVYFDKFIPEEHVIDKLRYACQLYIVVTGGQLFRRTNQKDIPVIRMIQHLGNTIPHPHDQKLAERILQHGVPVEGARNDSLLDVLQKDQDELT
jgi:hypothetical protein